MFASNRLSENIRPYQYCAGRTAARCAIRGAQASAAGILSLRDAIRQGGVDASDTEVTEMVTRLRDKWRIERMAAIARASSPLQKWCASTGRVLITPVSARSSPCRRSAARRRPANCAASPQRLEFKLVLFRVRNEETRSQMLTLESFELIALIGLAVILCIVYNLAFRLIEMRTRMGPLLYRVDAKLDLLLKQANIKFAPFANIPSDAAAAARAGKTIQAIKLYRQSSGVGLKEAKDFIEEFRRSVK
jgi:hypothetical protein